MAIWTPEAQWVGPSPNQSGAMVEQRGMILHVMQGSLAGSVAWGKNTASRMSFHFGTRKSDGLVQQLVDTDVTAWTQCAGNGRWISVENEDYSGNPLSAAQVESVARLYVRGVRTYGWPLQSTDDPAGRGLGWHGMGGVAWCNHPNCPGQPIKDQRPAILARAAQLLGAAPSQEEDMPMYGVRPGDPTVWAGNGVQCRPVHTEAGIVGGFPAVVGFPTAAAMFDRLGVPLPAPLDTAAIVTAVVNAIKTTSVDVDEAAIASAVAAALPKALTFAETVAAVNVAEDT